MTTFQTILRDNLKWRDKVFCLARFELKKQVRGSALSWAWLIIKPLVYIVCFWFALEIGLRAGRGMEEAGNPPFILWLSAGIFPWFFMSRMINGGSNVMRRFSYLVNKVKFPLGCIPTIYAEASMLVHFILLGVLCIVFLLCGQTPHIYLLQVPLILLLLFVFWYLFSLLMSIITAFSRDVLQLVKALSTPIFWLSGAIFNIKDVEIGWIQTLLDFNPVTFFINAYRDAFYYKTWFWNDTEALIGFIVVFAIVFVLAMLIYRRFHEEVADVV